MNTIHVLQIITIIQYFLFSINHNLSRPYHLLQSLILMAFLTRFYTPKTENENRTKLHFFQFKKLCLQTLMQTMLRAILKTVQ